MKELNSFLHNNWGVVVMLSIIIGLILGIGSTLISLYPTTNPICPLTPACFSGASPENYKAGMLGLFLAVLMLIVIFTGGSILMHFFGGKISTDKSEEPKKE
jgi:hypothetical protein